MKKRTRIAAIFAILLFLTALCFGFTQQAKAQEGIEVENVKVDYEFGEEVRFSAQIKASSPIQGALLIFRDEKEENTRILPLDVDEDGNVAFLYDASANLLRPFAKIIYWYQVSLENGESTTSAAHSFSYSDNRFEWETRNQGNLRVHWSKGDEAFGLAALDTARAGLANIARLFPVDLSQPIDIYIYPSPTDLQNALFLGGESWVAGHASPSLGIVLLSIAPNTQQQILMQKQIPHELMHVLLYRYVGENYNHLPTWLLEGLASISELYPNPDYQFALERAVENTALIPISALCQPFPQDASQAFLAYAEAESFVRYLYTNYGASGLDNLITAYADGLSCEAGTTRAFNTRLDSLDAHWLESALGANRLVVVWRAISPYALIFFLLLLPPLAEALSRKNRD